jgi:hypothetical protein
VRVGKEFRTAKAAAAVDKQSSICARKTLQRQTQASRKAAGFFRYKNRKGRTHQTKENGDVSR